MASSSASAPRLRENDLVTDLKEKLYECCKEEDPGVAFRQEDLLQMGIIPNNDLLLLVQVAQRLCDEKLFKLVREGTAAGWICRSRDDAAKYRTLTHEQEMVYALIDEAGAEGIWSKTIKTRSNLHDTTMRAAIKALESKRYITDMKSVEHLNRKMYIKASLTPSEKATGGPWYTDGELDEEFIDMIGNVLYNYIFAKSFYRSSSMAAARKSKKPKPNADKTIASASKGKGRPGPDEARPSRGSVLLDPKVKIEDEEERAAKKRRQDLDSFLPLPAGYQGYPTLDELTLFVENAKFSTTTLTKDDISQLLDVLCFDKRIEKVVSGPEGLAYKALRQTAQEMEDGPSNGFTEVPCGGCPVFDLCEEGGPVAPSNCEYFREWLSS